VARAKNNPPKGTVPVQRVREERGVIGNRGKAIDKKEIPEELQGAVEEGVSLKLSNPCPDAGRRKGMKKKNRSASLRIMERSGKRVSDGKFKLSA